jgi:hypothetical protein
MNRADRKRWAACRTLDDLCAVTIAFLAGDVRETPEHGGPPCEETAALIPVLAAANAAGYLTESSQPGVPLRDGSGQRAAVSGYAGDEVKSALAAITSGTRLLCTAQRSSAVRVSYASATVVTMDDGRPFTEFGARLPRKELRYFYGDACHADAAEAVCAAWQITIIDPQWGRNDVLWPVLEKFASARSAASR